MPDWSLYIHIPYCQAKCPYCDFNSFAASRWPEDAYIAALCAELRHYAEQPPWAGGRVRTIFFGGGTPSLFSAESIATILREVKRLWGAGSWVLGHGCGSASIPMTHDPTPEAIEVSLEANPGTITPEKLVDFRRAGVNRLSLGVQSFVPHHLRTLGRIHGADEALVAVHLARQAGFGNVSIDLIFALPQQTLDEWERDLVQACALNPDHISAYNLTYEEGTLFAQWRAHGTLQQLPEELEVAMFTRTQEILGTAGYQQYEISNYARPGYACRHNLNYWCGGEYLGIGAGAHSYVSEASDSRLQVSGPEVRNPRSAVCWGHRWSNEKNPSRYIEAIATAGHARAFRETLDERQARGEFVFLGLRCHDGFDATAFRARFGSEFCVLFPHALRLCDEGLLRCVGNRWQLTPRGLLLADSIFATFL